MSDTVPAPNDPAIVTSLADELKSLIDKFKDSVDAWQEEVDTVVVRLQNAGVSTVTPDGGITGQVPESGPGAPPQPSPQPPVEPAPVPSTEPTGSSTGVGSTPPEDTSVHHFSDPSHDDTITDPSGDDVQL